MQQRSTETQSPQCRRAKLIRAGGCLKDAVACAHIVQQQVRIQRHRLPVEQRIGVPAGGQDRNVAGRAAEGLEHSLASRNRTARRGSLTSYRSQEPHEVGKVIDTAHPRAAVADILDPTDDNGVAEYFVLTGEMGSQVLVSLPHFSTHTVTLVAHDASPPPVFMYATVFLGVVVAAETVLLVRRKVI